MRILWTSIDDEYHFLYQLTWRETTEAGSKKRKEAPEEESNQKKKSKKTKKKKKKKKDVPSWHLETEIQLLMEYAQPLFNTLFEQTTSIRSS